MAFVDELMELCESQGYSIQAVYIEGEIVEVRFKHERNKKSTITEDFRIKERSKV